MFQQKFTSLKSGRKIFFNSFFYNPRACESNEAPGSPIIISPSIAKDAVVPPNVGSVQSEMYGIFASDNKDSLPEVFASCIKENALSIIRAPPLLLMIMKGILCSMQ